MANTAFTCHQMPELLPQWNAVVPQTLARLATEVGDADAAVVLICGVSVRKRSSVVVHFVAKLCVLEGRIDLLVATLRILCINKMFIFAPIFSPPGIFIQGSGDPCTNSDCPHNGMHDNARGVVGRTESP